MEDLDRIAGSPVGVLGTILPDGRPHLAPVTFAVADGRVVTAVDWKPKSGRKLRRIANLEADPRATLLVHHYQDDWGGLWWVRVDAVGTLVDDGPEHERAVAALCAKYEQYAERPPEGTVIVLEPTGTARWGA